MTDCDGHNSSRDEYPVMESASGSRSLPFRLEQALLTDGPATVDQLTVLYECMAAQLDAVAASFRQAKIAKSARAATATFQEHWKARFEPLAAPLRALRELVEILDSRLAVMKTLLERQPVRPHPPPHGLHGNASTGSPIDPHALVIPTKAASTPLAPALYVTGSSPLSGVGTHHTHTSPQSSTVLQSPCWTLLLLHSMRLFFFARCGTCTSSPPELHARRTWRARTGSPRNGTILVLSQERRAKVFKFFFYLEYFYTTRGSCSCKCAHSASRDTRGVPSICLLLAASTNAHGV